jgi:DNA modification methylase
MKHYEDKNCNVDLLVWHKTNPIPTCNNKYLSDLEYCVFARESNTKLNGTYETKSKVWTSPANVADKDLFDHPTIKPLEFVKNHIINSTKEGDIVLDCFCGSGTTLVAAKELNRHYLGFEINPEYHKIAVDRLNGLTQKDVKRKDMGILDMFDFGVEDID